MGSRAIHIIRQAISDYLDHRHRIDRLQQNEEKESWNTHC